MKKIAIITGASSGIGRQIAIELSSNKFECLLAARDLEKLKTVQNECEGSRVLTLDLQDKDKIQTAVRTIKSCFNQKEKDDKHVVLINNAGIVERSKFENSSMRSWHEQFQTNLFGPVLFTQLLLPILKEQKSARILNISSTLGIKPIPETSAYSATKAALNSWTQCLALELAVSHIQVNAICPGIIETPLQSFFNTKDSKLRADLDRLQPLGRVGNPDDVARLALFLSEPSNNWITGSLYPVDGGILLG